MAVQGRLLAPRAGSPKALTFGPRGRGAFATAGAYEALRARRPVALCEGPIDALSLAQVGLPALALCGSDGLPPDLLERVFFAPVFVAFDADEAGDAKGALRLAELRASGAIASRLRPELGKDFNEWLQADPDGLRRWVASRLSPEAQIPAEDTPLPPDLLALARRGVAIPPAKEWAAWPAARREETLLLAGLGSGEGWLEAAPLWHPRSVAALEVAALADGAFLLLATATKTEPLPLGPGVRVLDPVAWLRLHRARLVRGMARCRALALLGASPGADRRDSRALERAAEDLESEAGLLRRFVLAVQEPQKT